MSAVRHSKLGSSTSVADFRNVRLMSALPPKANITHALVTPGLEKVNFKTAQFVHATTNFLLCPELATAFESLEFGACR